jgi:23S rRNA (pseudouridine1915-N3)-methyltransferase
MQLTLAHIGPKPPKSGAKAAYDTLTTLYLDRINPYYPIQTQAFPTEAAYLTWLARHSGPLSKTRTPALIILLDSRGKQLASSEFAAWLGARRDQGAQHLIFAIGPPDGWSQTTVSTLVLSFGPITLPHELARLVLAEQLYRACTILAGHPYHSGH